MNRVSRSCLCALLSLLTAVHCARSAPFVIPMFDSWAHAIGTWSGTGHTGGVPVRVDLELRPLFDGQYLQAELTFTERTGRVRKQLWIYHDAPGTGHSLV